MAFSNYIPNWLRMAKFSTPFVIIRFLHKHLTFEGRSMNSTLNTAADKMLERQNISKFWLVNSFLENFTCENTSGATLIQVSEYRHVTWWTFTFWFSKKHLRTLGFSSEKLHSILLTKDQGSQSLGTWELRIAFWTFKFAFFCLYLLCMSNVFSD